MKLAKYVMKKLKIIVIFENSCSKKFVHFQEKHPHEIVFLNKVVGYLTLTGNAFLGNICNFKNGLHKKTPANGGICN